MSDTVLDQFITGTLLGDAYVDRVGRYGFNHSSTQQPYFQSKVDFLVNHGVKLWTGTGRERTSCIDGRLIKPTTLLQAKTTRQHRWKLLRERFYPDGRKIVPADLTLTPQALAYWYMDDGTANLRSKYVSTHEGKQYHYVGDPFIQQFRLYTDGFDDVSLERLLKSLHALDIHGWLHTRARTTHKYIIISQLASRERFKALVYPTLLTVPSMLYKIDHPLHFQCERLNERAPQTVGDAIVRSHGNTNHESSAEMTEPLVTEE
jgi:hypothetical protein